jgi:hypothetical protein
MGNQPFGPIARPVQQHRVSSLQGETSHCDQPTFVRRAIQRSPPNQDTTWEVRRRVIEDLSNQGRRVCGIFRSRRGICPGLQVLDQWQSEHRFKF